MELLIGAAIVGVTLTALFFISRRDVTVALLEIEGGKVTVVQGGVAPPILADLREVARRARIAHARVRIVRDGGHASVTLTGSVGDGVAQQIRNVIGSVPLARLENANRRRGSRR